jgi:DNA polymerase III delta subunit
MMLLICSQDRSLLKERLAHYRKGFSLKYDASGLNCSVFDYGELDAAIEEARSAPFLADKRLVQISNIPKLKKAERESFFSHLEKLSDDLVLLLSFAEGVDESKHELCGFIEAHGKIERLKSYSEQDFMSMAANELSSAGIELPRPQIEQLARRCAGNLEALRSALDAIKAYGAAPSPDVFDALTPVSHDDKLFAFIDACSGSSAEQAYRLLKHERAQDTDDGALFGMLIRQVHLMYAAHMAPSAGVGELGMPPFAVRKLRTALNRYSDSQIVELRRSAIRLDRQMKTGVLSVSQAVNALFEAFFVDNLTHN